METISWENQKGEIVIVELSSDEEAFGSSWYARDFIEFLTSIIWDAYPSMRPLINRAVKSCFKVWKEQGMYAEPFYRRRYSKWKVAKHYINGLSWEKAGKFISDLAKGVVFAVGEKQGV